MHDIRLIRNDPDAFDAAMARRGIAPVAARLLETDAELRRSQTGQQEGQARRNSLSRRIGEARGRGEDTHALLREASDVEHAVAECGLAVGSLGPKLNHALLVLPNVLDTDVPDGTDETGNVVLHRSGEIPRRTFAARQHFELGESLGGMDFATAAKISGSRFSLLQGPLARLERALGQWMLDLHAREHGYTETSVPLLVNQESMLGTGQLPKFEEDLFVTTDGRLLIPTAEVPLTNTVRGDILPFLGQPVRLAALSTCFRAEAGSAGRDARGLIRQHQFSKVELVSITAPDDSDAEHERMTACAERVLTELGLTWRRVLLCAGDTGFGAAKTYDLEVWLPGQEAWREISSCSNMRDFQARRMNARMKPREGKGNVFLHTLNGSGVAVGRALVAVMETHQRDDGSIGVPPVLSPLLDGASAITREGFVR